MHSPNIGTTSACVEHSGGQTTILSVRRRANNPICYKSREQVLGMKYLHYEKPPIVRNLMFKLQDCFLSCLLDDLDGLFVGLSLYGS